jgi:hypothetical protein
MTSPGQTHLLEFPRLGSKTHAPKQARSRMHLDDFLPSFHFSERHQTLVQASPKHVYDSTRSLDFAHSPVIRWLMWLRQTPGRLLRFDFENKGLGFTFDDFEAAGFIRLMDDPPNEFVLGAVGIFWKLTPQLVDLSPEEFKSFDSPGYAKVAFNIRIDKTDTESCLVSTESRILCLDNASRRRFRLYWALIRPFSGLIRIVMLRAIRKASEQSSS